MKKTTAHIELAKAAWVAHSDHQPGDTLESSSQSNANYDRYFVRTWLISVDVRTKAVHIEYNHARKAPLNQRRANRA